jgi:hypothetical protein
MEKVILLVQVTVDQAKDLWSLPHRALYLSDIPYEPLDPRTILWGTHCRDETHGGRFIIGIANLLAGKRLADAGGLAVEMIQAPSDKAIRRAKLGSTQV